MAAIWVRASATRGTIQTADDIVILPFLPRRAGSAPASRRDRWPARSAPGEWPSDRPAWDQPRHPRSRRETPRTPPLHPPLGSGPARRSAPRAVVLRVVPWLASVPRVPPRYQARLPTAYWTLVQPAPYVGRTALAFREARPLAREGVDDSRFGVSRPDPRTAIDQEDACVLRPVSNPSPPGPRSGGWRRARPGHRTASPGTRPPRTAGCARGSRRRRARS